MAKAQQTSGWKQASKSTRPSAIPSSIETRHEPEVTQKKEDARDVSYFRKRLDPLSNHLGITTEGFYHNMRWEWFRYDFGGVSYPLQVALYYPSLNLAIDIAPNDSREVAEAKKKLLAEKKIRYAILASAGDFKRLEGL